jgi:hypothetical protein
VAAALLPAAAPALERPLTLLSRPAPGVKGQDAPAFLISNEQRSFTADLLDREVSGGRALVLSDQRLAAADTDDSTDIYWLDGRKPRLVSGGTGPVDDDEYVSVSAISRDGKVVAWESDADLVPEDADRGYSRDEPSGGTENRDVYVSRNGRTVLASRGSNEDENVTFEAMTDDGRVYFSTRLALLPEDTDTWHDVYEDSEAGLRLVTPPHPPGASDDTVLLKDVSADGRVRLFASWERWAPDDVGDGLDYYVQAGGQLVRITPNGVGDDFTAPLMSRDGARFVYSTEVAETPDDADGSVDLYEWTRAGLRKLSPGNGPFDLLFPLIENSVSADRTRVILSTGERLTADDRDDEIDAYLAVGGKTRLLAPSKAAVGAVLAPSGQLALGSDAPLTRDDRDEQLDVFVPAGRGLRRICAGPAGGNRDSEPQPWVRPEGATPTDCRFGAFSRDGSHLLFTTYERLTRDDKDGWGLSAYEHVRGRTTLVRMRGRRSTQGAGEYSPDGRYLYFHTDRPLVREDRESAFDVYRAGPEPKRP